MGAGIDSVNLFRTSRVMIMNWGPWRRYILYSGSQECCLWRFIVQCYGWISANFTMMTSSNGNIFALLALCGDFTSYRLIPLTNASDAELWCSLWSAPEQLVEQTIGDLRRHCAHYDVTVMILPSMLLYWQWHKYVVPGPVEEIWKICINVSLLNSWHK